MELAVEVPHREMVMDGDPYMKGVPYLPPERPVLPEAPGRVFHTPAGASSPSRGSGVVFYNPAGAFSLSRGSGGGSIPPPEPSALPEAQRGCSIPPPEPPALPETQVGFHTSAGVSSPRRCSGRERHHSPMRT